MSNLNISFAASRLINPPGAEPQLTEAQVWKGLELKCREPQKFVLAIKACDVLKDSGNKISRKTYLEDGSSMIEDITLYPGTMAYFDGRETHIRVTNIVSYDANDQMTLTFSFAGGIPGFKSSADKLPPSALELNKTVGAGVQHTIDKIRELVREGSL